MNYKSVNDAIPEQYIVVCGHNKKILFYIYTASLRQRWFWFGRQSTCTAWPLQPSMNPPSSPRHLAIERKQPSEWLCTPWLFYICKGNVESDWGLRKCRKEQLINSIAQYITIESIIQPSSDVPADVAASVVLGAAFKQYSTTHYYRNNHHSN